MLTMITSIAATSGAIVLSPVAPVVDPFVAVVIGDPSDGLLAPLAGAVLAASRRTVARALRDMVAHLSTKSVVGGTPSNASTSSCVCFLLAFLHTSTVTPKGRLVFLKMFPKSSTGYTRPSLST